MPGNMQHPQQHEIYYKLVEAAIDKVSGFATNSTVQSSCSVIRFAVILCCNLSEWILFDSSRLFKNIIGRQRA